MKLQRIDRIGVIDAELQAITFRFQRDCEFDAVSIDGLDIAEAQGRFRALQKDLVVALLWRGISDVQLKRDRPGARWPQRHSPMQAETAVRIVETCVQRRRFKTRLIAFDMNLRCRNGLCRA